MARSAILIVFVCVACFLLNTAVAEERTTKKKESVLGKIFRKRQLAQSGSNSNYDGNLARQEDFSEYSYHDAYNNYNDPASSSSTTAILSNKDDPLDRVGIVAGKKILKIIGIVLIGLVAIGLPLLPLALIALILFNLPVVKIIDIPQFDGWFNNDNNNNNIMRSLTNFEETCIEKISCQIAKRSGSYGKIMVQWMQKKFTKSQIMKRISRGFEHLQNCEEYICSNTLLKKIL